jgi:hypothetical protein
VDSGRFEHSFGMGKGSIRGLIGNFTGLINPPFFPGFNGNPHGVAWGCSGVVRCKPPNPRVGRMRSGCTRPHVRTLLTLFFWLCLHNIRIVARASDHGCHGRYQHVARMCTGNMHMCAGKPLSAYVCMHTLRRVHKVSSYATRWTTQH